MRVADAAVGAAGDEGPCPSPPSPPSPSDAPTPAVGGWTVAHCDIVEDAWWEARPHLLEDKGRGGGGA